MGKVNNFMEQWHSEKWNSEQLNSELMVTKFRMSTCPRLIIVMVTIAIQTCIYQCSQLHCPTKHEHIFTCAAEVKEGICNDSEHICVLPAVLLKEGYEPYSDSETVN